MKENDIGQARLVKAESKEQALAYFAEIELTATVHGASLDQCNLERRGCPVEIVPDGWQPATSEQEQAEAQDTTPITAEINSMCADCASLGNGCKGTACKTWTGCIYKRADAPSTAAVLDEALTAKHEEAKHFNDAMSERFDPISEIIILHAIAKAAEEVYDNHPEDEHAEQIFDEAYKDAWNAVESFVESLTDEFKCSAAAARAAIYRYVDAHPVAFRDEHGCLVWLLRECR